MLPLKTEVLESLVRDLDDEGNDGTTRGYMFRAVGEAIKTLLARIVTYMGG